MITSVSWIKLSAGLGQLKLVSTGGGEGEEWVKVVENNWGEEEADGQTEYCCRVTVSADSNAGLAKLLRVGGRNEAVVDGGVGYEVDEAASELLRWRPLDSKSRRRASRRDILPSNICFLLFGFLSVYLHSSRLDRKQGVQIGFKPSHF